MTLLPRIRLRNAFVVALALSLAMLMEWYFKSVQSPWLFLATSLTALPFLGPLLRQSLIGTALLFTLVLSLGLITGTSIAYGVAIAAWLILGVVFYYTRPHAEGLFTFYWPYLLAIFMVCLLPTFKVINVPQALFEVLLGSSIGVACNVLIYPGSFASLFSRGILPSLRQLQTLVREQSYPFANPDRQDGFFQPWFDAMHTLLRGYPHWIYYVGFNPGLRAGARRFLIQLNRAFDACLTANFWGAKVLKEHEYHNLHAGFQRVATTNLELVQILIDYFSQHKIPNTQTDWIADMADLEALIKPYVTVDLNVLEMVPEQLALVSTLHHIRDLRRALLELARALPPPPKPRYNL